MEQALKQRLIGASVLIALAVIFLPAILTGPQQADNQQPDDFYIPPDPVLDNSTMPTRRLPVMPPAGSVNAPPPQNETDTAAQQITPLEELQPQLAGDNDVTGIADSTAVVAADHDQSTQQVNDAQQANDAQQDSGDQSNELVEVAPSAAPTELTSQDVGSADISAQDWRLQLATLGNTDNINRLRAQLTAAGIQSQQLRLQRGDNVLFRVLTGPYASEAAAQAAIAEIQRIDQRLRPVVLAPETTGSSVGNGTPKPAPVQSPAAASLQRFAVQAGVFSEQGNAGQMVKQLTGAGYAAYMEQVDGSNGSQLHRVRIGPLLSETDAEQIVQELSTSLQVKGMVVNYQ